LPAEKFGSSVMGAAAGCLKAMYRGLVEGRHTKVGNFDLAPRRKKDVLRLEVTVADIEGVAARNGTHYLPEEVHSTLFGEAPVACDVREQIAVVDVLENKITASRRQRGQGHNSQ